MTISTNFTKDGIAAIRFVVRSDMAAMEGLIQEATRSHVTLLRIALRYFLKSKGKQIRPILVMLTAGLHGLVNDRAHVGAALVELLHQATLLHDDVVDGAQQRRGWWTVNAVWKNKIAVLLGDFLLSAGLRLALRHKAYDFLDMICQCVEQMSEGELLQAQKARTQKINEAVYYEIIEKKTACLWGICCRMGAVSGGASAQAQESMYALGLALGLAFQMRDDLFDYEATNKAGKPLGLDLKERKLTLPILRALDQSTPSQRRALRQSIKRNNRDQVLAHLARTDAFDYTKKAMEVQTNQAMDILAGYPDSPYRQALLDLVAYTCLRQR